MKLYTSFAFLYFFIIGSVTHKTLGEMVLTQYGGDDFGSSGDYGSSTDYGTGDTSYEHATDDASSSSSDPVDSYSSETEAKDVSPTDDYTEPKSVFKIPKEAHKFIKDVAKGIIKGALKPKSVSKPKTSPKLRMPLAPKRKQAPLPKKKPVPSPKKQTKNPTKKPVSVKKPAKKPYKKPSKSNKKPAKKPSGKNLRTV